MKCRTKGPLITQLSPAVLLQSSISRHLLLITGNETYLTIMTLIHVYFLSEWFAGKGEQHGSALHPRPDRTVPRGRLPARSRLEWSVS